MIIDTHAHLMDRRFESDRSQVIARATESGVSKIIEIACEPANWKNAINFADNYSWIFCALGIHPQEAKLFTAAIFGELEDLAKLPKVCAIGETGLDYYHENSPRDIQKKVFEKHIELAVKINKPLSIHCRDAYNDTIEILQKNPCRGVIHCFSGTLHDAQQFINMGFYLGIDGPLTYPKSEMLRQVVKEAPLERIIIETDCPYLPPQAFRGKRNEPSYVTHIAGEIARIRAIELENAIQILTSNSKTLFGLRC